MGYEFSSQSTNANKHKQRNRTFESWIKNGGISRLQKLFFKWNVESCNRKFPSVLVSPLNIRYSDEYIKYQRSPYLRNRPKNIIDHLLRGKGADDHAMIKLVKPINRTCYFVKGFDLTELKKKEYDFGFGNKRRYCSCTCPDFKNNSLICKQFFVVIEGNHRKFNDISPLFRDHVWINLDRGFTMRLIRPTKTASDHCK